MSDLADNIRRIVGVDELKDKLKELAEKVAIFGRRGIAYEPVEGGLETNSAGGDLVTTGVNAAAAAATKAALQSVAESASRERSDKATGDATNAALDGKSLSGDRIKSADDGTFDAEEYFDNASAGALEGADIGQRLSALTGFKNLNGNKNVNVRFDGMYVPPLGYSDVDDNAGWVQGFLWHASGIPAPTVPDGATAPEAVGEYLNYLNVLGGGADTFDYTDLVVDNNAGTMTFTILITNVATGITTENTGGTGSRSACTLGTLACPITEPYYWPRSDTVQLSQNKYVAQGLVPYASGFSAHPRDPNAPTDLAGVQSRMELTFALGTRSALIEPNNLGGSTISEIDPVTKDYIGQIRVYDAAGILAAYADSGTIANYAP